MSKSIMLALGIFLGLIVNDIALANGLAQGGAEVGVVGEMSIEEFLNAAAIPHAAVSNKQHHLTPGAPCTEKSASMQNCVENQSIGVANTVKAKKKPMPALHHVVGVPLLKEMKPPVETMPLGEKKELVCKTCHGIKNIKDLPYDKVDKKADEFLNGGPYRVLTDFCYNCHLAKDYERPNIHSMLDAQGKIKEQHCKYCHVKVLKRNQVYKPDDLRLRMPRENLCYGCHLKTPHLNAVQHQVKPSKEKLKQLEKSVKKLGIILPLSSKGEMMCVTCHSPHPNGVLESHLAAARQVPNRDLKQGVSYSKHPWSAVYADDKQARLAALNAATKQHHELQYQRISAEVLLRLPAKDGSLCLACHTFEDRE